MLVLTLSHGACTHWCTRAYAVVMPIFTCACTHTHAQGGTLSHSCGTMHLTMFSACVCLYKHAHAHIYSNILVCSSMCVHTAGVPTHTLTGTHAYICTPLQYMHTLIHLYNFMSHTPPLAQTCRCGEGLSEETQRSGFKSRLFPFLAVWLWVGRYLTLRVSVSHLSKEDMEASSECWIIKRDHINKEPGA